MPTLADYREHLIRSDYGMLTLVALTALVVGALIFLYRKWATAPGMVSEALDHQEVDPPFRLPFALPFRLPRLNLFAILVVALLLRLPLMGQSFWYDEAFTQRITTLSLDQLPAAILADTHPPLFYSLIWLWSRLVGSGSEVLLRLPSLAFGLLLIALLYRLVKAAGLSETTALIAALLCAVTPSSIYYGTELRNYAMLTCAVFGAILCLLEDRPKGFILSTMLVGWLHNLGLLYVPLLCAGALIYHFHILNTLPALARVTGHVLTHQYERMVVAESPVIRDRSIRAWMISVAAAASLALVWLPITLQQSQSVSDGFWIYFNAAVPSWLFTLNLLYVPTEYIFPLLLPYIGLLFLGFYGARDFFFKTTAGRLLLMLLLGVPALAILVSVVWAPVFLPRIFLPLTLLMLLPLAETVNRNRTTILPGAVTLSLAALAVFYASAAPLTRPDYHTMIQEGCAGTTALYTTAIDTAITVAPYWSADRGPSLVWENSSDRGGTFKPGQLPLYGFESGEIATLQGNTVCMVYVFTPRTLQPEREKVTQIILSYRSTVQSYKLHDELEVDIFKVEVK